MQRFQLIRGGKTPESKLEQRARVLSASQVRDWADAYLVQAGQSLLFYSREGDPRALDAAEEASVALLALVRELKTRSGS